MIVAASDFQEGKKEKSRCICAERVDVFVGEGVSLFFCWPLPPSAGVCVEECFLANQIKAIDVWCMCMGPCIGWKGGVRGNGDT